MVIYANLFINYYFDFHLMGTNLQLFFCSGTFYDTLTLENSFRYIAYKIG